MYYGRIKELRESHEMTQDQVAEYLNVTTRAYAAFESGDSSIPVQCIMKLAFLYKTSTDYILGRTNEIKPYMD